MSKEMYEILSLFARYFFAALMILIAFRAWRITIKDNRRAKLLRDWSPETGCVGQLVVAPGQANGKIVSIPREGILGSSASADMQIAAKGILPQHAHFESREGGLLIRPLGRAQMALGRGKVTGDQLLAQDGDVLTIGPVKAMVVLFDPTTTRLDEPAGPAKRSAAAKTKATPESPAKPGKPAPGNPATSKAPAKSRFKAPRKGTTKTIDEGIAWLNKEKESRRRD